MYPSPAIVIDFIARRCGVTRTLSWAVQRHTALCKLVHGLILAPIFDSVQVKEISVVVFFNLPSRKSTGEIRNKVCSWYFLMWNERGCKQKFKSLQVILCGFTRNMWGDSWEICRVLGRWSIILYFHREVKILAA